MEYKLLRSQVENSFGDQDDDEGFPDFLQQLEFYSDLAPSILKALHDLAESGDPDLCLELVGQYARRPVTAEEAVAWVRDLQEKVSAARGGETPAPET